MEKDKINLVCVSGSFVTENQCWTNVEGRMFIDELGNKREAKLIKYDAVGIPWIKWKGRPLIGSQCAYNLRINKKMKWI